MLIPHFAAYMLAIYFATPSKGIWDFHWTLRTDHMIGRALIVGKTEITVVPTEQKLGPTTFPFHFRLAMGSYNLLAGPGGSYTRDDVQVGDIVSLRRMKMRDKIEYCIDISISRRPGGKIPPDRTCHDWTWQPYHEVVEASHAYNDDKVPFPRHLAPLTRDLEYPAFDPRLPRQQRIRRFPFDRPFTYIEYALFMR